MRYVLRGHSTKQRSLSNQSFGLRIPLNQDHFSLRITHIKTLWDLINTNLNLDFIFFMSSQNLSGKVI